MRGEQACFHVVEYEVAPLGRNMRRIVSVFGFWSCFPTPTRAGQSLRQLQLPWTSAMGDLLSSV